MKFENFKYVLSYFKYEANASKEILKKKIASLFISMFQLRQEREISLCFCLIRFVPMDLSVVFLLLVRVVEDIY